MQWLQIIGSIVSVLGIPSVFTLVFALHRKHVSILDERVRLLQKINSDLEKKLDECSLHNIRSLINDHKALLEEADGKIGKLNQKIIALQREVNITQAILDKNMGNDYRTEILREQEKNRGQST